MDWQISYYKEEHTKFPRI